LLLPLLVLGPCLWSDRTYLPYDLGEYAPESLEVTAAEATARNAEANKDATEPPVWFVPEYELAREALAAGRWPQWNPYARLGSPLFAHGHMGFADPLHWPALVTPTVEDGLWVLSALMFGLGGLLSYGLLRSLRLPPSAAFFGAVAAGLSGTLAANGPWFMRMEPLVLLPGMLWAALAVSRRRGIARAAPAAGLAVLLGLAWLAGFPPFAVPVTGVVAVWCAGLALRCGGLGAAVRCASWLLAAGLVGLALAAVQLWPQLEFLPWSNRPTQPGGEFLSKLCFDPFGLVGWALPEAFGHPTNPGLPYASSPFAQLWSTRTDWATGAALRSNYNFTEYALFAGTLPLVLAVVGLAAGWRSRAAWFGAVIAAGLIAVATGGPLVRWVFSLPGLDSAPPMRFVGPVFLCVAALAAWGWKQLFCAPQIARRAAFIGAIVSLLGAGAAVVGAMWLGGMVHADDPLGIAETLAVRFSDQYPGIDAAAVRANVFTGPAGEDYLVAGYERLTAQCVGAAWRFGAAFVWCALLVHCGPRRILGAVALVATALELALFAQALNRGVEATPLGETAIHRFLRDARQGADREGGFAVLRIGVPPRVPIDLPAGTLARDRIRDLQAYTFVDGRSSPLLAARFGPGILSAKDDNLETFPPRVVGGREPLLDALGVRFVIGTHEGVPDGLAPRRVAAERTAPDGRWMKVWERPSALPRAWFVPGITATEDPVSVLTSDDWDPRLAAVVDSAALPVDGFGERAPATASRTVGFRVDRPQHIELEVGEGPAGYVVLADAALPGWSARVGEVPVPWLRANGCMRVIPVPAGACVATMEYETPGLRRGLVVTAGALLLVLLAGTIGAFAAFRGRRRRRRGADLTGPTAS